ncbi:MAG TPA: hypothetical protein DDZ43_09580 [Hyphomonadaceae bacterium]|nr:hypothetical protein [Hyphomonadaceae bacterium]
MTGWRDFTSWWAPRLLGALSHGENRWADRLEVFCAIRFQCGCVVWFQLYQLVEIAFCPLCAIDDAGFGIRRVDDRRVVFGMGDSDCPRACRLCLQAGWIKRKGFGDFYTLRGAINCEIERICSLKITNGLLC